MRAKAFISLCVLLLTSIAQAGELEGLTKEEAARLLKRGARYVQTPCIWPLMGGPAPEERGLPGFEQQRAPGLYVLRLSTVLTNPAERDRRDVQIDKLRALARAGFFTESDATLASAERKPAPARAFTLTWNGWTAMSDQGECFPTGTNDTYEVQDVAKLSQSVAGMEVWQVTYTTAQSRAAAWALSEDMKRHFHELRAGNRPVSITKVVRSPAGWLTEAELRLGNVPSPAQLAAEKIHESTPKLDAAAAERAMQDYLALNPDRRPRMCLQLPYTLAQEVGDIGNRYLGQELFLVFKNDVARLDPPKIRETAAAVNWMEGLARAGLAKSEKTADGVRFTLPAAMKSQIDPQGRRGCLSIGESTTETVAVSDTRRPASGRSPLRREPTCRTLQPIWTSD